MVTMCDARSASGSTILFASALLLTIAHTPKEVVCAPKVKDRVTAAVHPATQQQYYFWNEITGELQWEDPGDVPFEDEAGIRHWLGSQGEKLSEDPNGHQYSWVEFYSEDLQKTYYYNQDTKETTWSKPIDLAWRRVPVRVPR